MNDGWHGMHFWRAGVKRARAEGAYRNWRCTVSNERQQITAVSRAPESKREARAWCEKTLKAIEDGKETNDV